MPAARFTPEALAAVAELEAQVFARMKAAGKWVEILEFRHNLLATAEALEAARARGAKVVVIDPRQTGMARALLLQGCGKDRGGDDDLARLDLCKLGAQGAHHGLAVEAVADAGLDVGHLVLSVLIRPEKPATAKRVKPQPAKICSHK